MVRLAIKNIRRDPWVPVRLSGNDQETVQGYMEAFDHLPPVEFIKTLDGYLLADGFHRIAAAILLGHDKIEANVRKGTHDDALELAALANLRHGQPLTREDRNARSGGSAWHTRAGQSSSSPPRPASASRA